MLLRPLNRCCVTVAKRLDILKVNIKMDSLFFTDRKKKLSDLGSIVSEIQENVGFPWIYKGVPFVKWQNTHFSVRPYFCIVKSMKKQRFPRTKRKINRWVFNIFSICKKQSREFFIYLQDFRSFGGSCATSIWLTEKRECWLGFWVIWVLCWLTGPLIVYTIKFND